jgi:TBC1 domain family protein 5
MDNLVVRTYQSIDLFSQEFIKKLLLNILFIWCKENDDVSYRQGMNELLAVLILCFYPYYFKFDNEKKPTKDEVIEYLKIKDENDKNKYINKIYNYFHDEEEIESDLFFTFDSLMKKGIKNLFNPKILQKNEPDYKLYELFPDIFKDDIDEDKPNYISRRCFLLINEKLKIIDEELYLYFKKVDIICGAFLQKWFRCIFCREFELNQVFILWDVILVEDFVNEKNQKYSLAFMDSICLAMILRLRKYILNRDQNDCFSLLFKYPKIDNIKNIIILAYHIHQIILQKKMEKILIIK